MSEASPKLKMSPALAEAFAQWAMEQAAHAEALAAALHELHAWSLPFVQKSSISAETQWRRFPQAIKEAKAALTAYKDDAKEGA